jgi:tetratricopeptide (TPR) repeat protein
MKKTIIILFVLISTICYSQYDYGNNQDALSLCLAYQQNLFSSNQNNKQTNFNSITLANDKLGEILSVIGASKRFIVQPCSNINNALAVQFKGIRYILYDPEFMNALSKQNSWSNYFILAHEVGHHVNGHALDIILYATDTVDSISLSESRQQELEADEFAGFVLAKLGATFEQTISDLDKYSSDDDDTYSTHPNKTKRLKAIKKGYNTAKIQSDKYQAKSLKLTADDYFYRAVQRDDLDDYKGALADYNSCIDLDNNFAEAYNNRGLIYLYKTIQYDLSLSDFNKAIDLLPGASFSYFNRAMLKMRMSQEFDDSFMFEAIADLTKSIQINPSYGEAFSNRGMCKYRSLGWQVGCSDFLKAKALGVELPDFIETQFVEFGCD